MMAKCCQCKVSIHKDTKPITLGTTNKRLCGLESCRSSLIDELSAKLAIKAQNARESEYKREKTKKLAALNSTIQHWKPKAQAMFNKWVRTRDKDLSCISCGEIWDKDIITGSGWDAGHYRSRGSCPELRFEPLNCHKQCVKCNRNLSGNIVEYRLRLIKRIGIEKVEWVESNHDLPKLRVDDYKELYEKYRLLVKEMDE